MAPATTAATRFRADRRLADTDCHRETDGDPEPAAQRPAGDRRRDLVL